MAGPLPSPTPMNQTPEALGEALWLVVRSMERLEARIHRDLHAEADDSAPPADPVWAAVLSDFSQFADECMTTLSDPRVRSVLAGWPHPADEAGDRHFR